MIGFGCIFQQCRVLPGVAGETVGPDKGYVDPGVSDYQTFSFANEEEMEIQFVSSIASGLSPAFIYR